MTARFLVTKPALFVSFQHMRYFCCDSEFPLDSDGRPTDRYEMIGYYVKHMGKVLKKYIEFGGKEDSVSTRVLPLKKILFSSQLIKKNTFRPPCSQRSTRSTMCPMSSSSGTSRKLSLATPTTPDCRLFQRPSWWVASTWTRSSGMTRTSYWMRSPPN